jgi:hypothetical protein
VKERFSDFVLFQPQKKVGKKDKKIRKIFGDRFDYE